MALYRNVAVRFWTDPEIKKLGRNEKFFALYLITGPHSHCTGIYYLTPKQIKEDIGLSGEGLKGVWKSLERINFAHYDPYTETVFVVNMMGYQIRGEVALQSAAKQFSELHYTFLMEKFIEKYPLVKKYLNKGLLDRVLGGSKGGANTPTDPDTDTDPVSDPEKKKKKLTASKLLTEIEIPAELKTPELEIALSDWQEHRKQKKKPLTPKQIERQLQKLASEGPAAATYRLNRSIENGWQGLWFPSDAADTTLQALLKKNGRPPVSTPISPARWKSKFFAEHNREPVDDDELLAWIGAQKGKVE